MSVRSAPHALVRKAAFALVVFAALIVPATAASAAPLTISVTPNTMLLTGDRVSVNGSGAGSFARVALYTCLRTAAADVFTNGGCGGYMSSVQADASGAYQSNEVFVIDGQVCGYDRCALVAIQTVGLVVVASAAAPISFAPGITLTPLSPTTGLNGGETVNVRVTGLRAGQEFAVGYCASDGPPYDCGGAEHTAGVGGWLDVALEQLPGWTYSHGEFGDPQIRSCRPPGSCHVIAWLRTGANYYDIGEWSSIPLTYRGEQIRATFSPTENLTDNALVSVSGLVLGAEGRVVEVRQKSCFAIIQGSGCHFDQLVGSRTVAADGTFSFNVRVDRTPPTRNGTYDCASPPDGIIFDFCELSIWVTRPDGSYDPSFGTRRSGWLGFLPDEPALARIGDISVREGTGGSRSAIVPVTLAAPSSVAVTVTVRTVNDYSAKAPGDYFGRGAATVSFPPGQTAGSVWILLATDAVKEPTERFLVEGVSVSGGGSFTKPKAWVYITNDD